MARKPKNVMNLPDGRKVTAYVQQRGTIWRAVYADPDRPKKYKEVSTGKTNEGDAWAELAKLVVAAYSPTAKMPPAKAKWDEVIKELPNVKSFRPRALQAYTSRINVFRQLVPASKGPFDVTAAVAEEFARKYQTGTFTKSNKSGAKQYPRSPNTVRTTLRLLSCLWGHLRKKGFATVNPCESVARPEEAKAAPTAPREEDLDKFFEWVDAKGWELLSVFLRVKALLCCRTNDLCQLTSSQFDSQTATITIHPSQDKTHRERKVPLPADLAQRLDRIKGKTYLWERYVEDSKTHRPGRRNATEFSPSVMYWFVDDLFPAYRKAFPARPHITAHDLRRRGITLLVKAHGLDRTAEALGIHPDTARKHYLDAKKAFDSKEMFREMAKVLVPQTKAAEGQ